MWTSNLKTNMKRTLIVVETSYAGMGPYVSEIVNSFMPQDDVFYFFHELDDDYYPRNIKPELLHKSFFVTGKNTLKFKLYTNLTWKYGFDNKVIELCEKWAIQQVYFINGCCDPGLVKKLKKMSVTSISAVHDLHPHEAKKSIIKMIKHYNFYARNKYGRECCDVCITNSKEQYRELITMYPNKKIFYHDFPSLVTDNIAFGSHEVEELKDNSEPYILFFGRIEKYKGVDILIEAFRKLANVTDNLKLVVAGKGKVDYQPTDNDRILLIDRFIKDEEVGDLYSKASFVVYPYISATQSGVLSVAMYFGTPIIASDVPFFKDIMLDSKAGLLFSNGDSNDLYLKMKAMLSKDMKSFRDNERSYYQNKYDKEAIRTALLEIFN